MKTAILLPDTLFADAEKTAKKLGIAPNQLFEKALEEFISRHKKESITEKYNVIYSKINSDEDLAIKNLTIKNLRELTSNDTW